MTEEFIGISDFAKETGISRPTIYKKIEEGLLSAVRDPLTGRWKIPVSELRS